VGRALAGEWGVFGVRSGDAGVEREEAQGKRLATLAREAASNTPLPVRGIGAQATGFRKPIRQQVALEEPVRGLRSPRM